MQLNKEDIIRDGDNYYSVFCVLWTVIYVKPISGNEHKQYYPLEDILKHYRKIEIMEKVNNEENRGATEM